MKLIDLSGQRFGRLIAVEYVGNSKWKCLCDCGNETEVFSSNLTKGRTKSCGCLARETTSKIKFKNIAGMKFGRLTALEVFKKDGKRTIWKCQCECGNVSYSNVTNLINGTTKSCGCLQKENSSKATFKDITGKRFGKLVAIERIGSRNGKALWRCRCDCGKYTDVPGSALRSGGTKSCGCLHNERIKETNVTHGMTKTRLYRKYQHMKGRCYTKTDSRYMDYGGRGIKICDEWLGENGFENFYKWAIENGYSEDGNTWDNTIDRINNDGDYCPENCRIVNQLVQSNNRRTNRLETANGETHTIAEWSRKTGIPSGSIIYKLNSGAKPEEFLK